MADGISGAENRFELFSGIEDGFGPIRHDGRTPRTSPVLPGMEVEAVDGEDTTPFYERAMGREEEDEILAEDEEARGARLDTIDERKVWEVGQAWAQHLGEDLDASGGPL